MNQRRIYLSGPMTGIADHNFPAFSAEAARLRGAGYDVVNPTEINPNPGTSWHECLRRDLVELLTCDMLALLPGWQHSSGAHLEMHVAHRVGMEIVIAAELGIAGRPHATTTKIEAAVDAYLLSYELCGESESGADCTHTPNELEQLMLKDAIMGLLSDETFIAAQREETVYAVNHGDNDR